MPIEAADAGITDATGAAPPLAQGASSGNGTKANPLRGNFTRLFSLVTGLVGNSGGRPRSIRSRLIRIVFILIAPAVMGLAALAVGVYQHEREQLSQATLSTARALTAALDRDLAGIMTAAQVLAQSPFLAADDFASFHSEAKRLVPLVHGFAIRLVDATGQQIVNTLRPYGEPLPARGDRQNEIKVFETGQPSFSDLFTGAISKTLAVNVDVPVYRDNRVKYALGIAVHPAKLTDLFQNQSLPLDWVATITDSSGVIVARSRRPDLIGQRTPVRLSAMAGSRSGVIELISFEGLPVFAGFSKSEVSNWTVTIGVPMTQLYRKPNAVLLYGALGVLGVLIFGLIMALYESTRIARAVQNLIPSALALGRGELPNIAPSSIQETDEVAQALERAHELLQRRTQERDHAKLTIAARSLADEMFRLAVEACPNGMVMIDATGRIVMVNTEIEHQFGYAREDLVGQPVDILVPERLRTQHARHRREFTPKPETRRMGGGRDLFGRRKDGTEFPVEVGLNPIRSGDDLMVLSVIVDISQRKRTERLKNEFVATVSHELRTPLTSISGSLGLLEGRWAKDMPESAARLLTIAHTNSKRLARLINDILDIEKIESGHVVFNLSRVAVRSLVEQAIEDNRGYADSYGIRVRLDASSADADANVDPDRFAQIIANLLSNAIKFSPADGEVVVAVEADANHLRVTVRDHGPGIPDDFKPHIFEKFAQADATDARKKSGTGLGLSIVKQIVERLGGKVGFEDAPGGGAMFYVELPVWDGRAGGEIDLDTETGARILLCEDDRDAALVVREQLRQAGFAVDFAHTVAAAATRAQAKKYAAILVDLQLPDGDGVSLMVRLRAQPHNCDVPIIVMAGDPDQGRSDVRSNRLKVLRWLTKPVAFAPLVDTLKTAVAEPPRQRPRILHVDDDYEALALVNRELSSIADVVSADSLESARRILATDRIDLAVLDIALGQESGLDLLADLRGSLGKAIPVIIFSIHGADMTCDDHVRAALPKVNPSLEKLWDAVRDRLATLPA